MGDPYKLLGFFLFNENMIEQLIKYVKFTCDDNNLNKLIEIFFFEEAEFVSGWLICLSSHNDKQYC